MRHTLLAMTVVLGLLFGRAYAGDGVGNGGGIVVCSDTQGKLSYTVLDIYQAQANGYQPDFGPSTDFQAKAAYVLQRLSKFDSQMQTELSQRMQYLWSVVAYSQTPLPLVGDFGAVLLPENCYLKQLALQTNPTLSMDPGQMKATLSIDAFLWSQIDNNGKAALLLHEALYNKYLSLEASPYKLAPNGSVDVRAYVAGIVDAKLFPSMATKDFLLWTADHNFVMYRYANQIALNRAPNSANDFVFGWALQRGYDLIGGNQWFTTVNPPYPMPVSSILLIDFDGNVRELYWYEGATIQIGGSTIESNSGPTVCFYPNGAVQTYLNDNVTGSYEWGTFDIQGNLVTMTAEYALQFYPNGQLRLFCNQETLQLKTSAGTVQTFEPDNVIRLDENGNAELAGPCENMLTNLSSEIFNEYCMDYDGRYPPWTPIGPASLTR